MQCINRTAELRCIVAFLFTQRQTSLIPPYSSFSLRNFIPPYSSFLLTKMCSFCITLSMSFSLCPCSGFAVGLELLALEILYCTDFGHNISQSHRYLKSYTALTLAVRLEPELSEILYYIDFGHKIESQVSEIIHCIDFGCKIS